MKRQVLVLLLMATIDRVVLQGIYPILPVMIAGLGVSKKGAGVFMAVTYVAIALGSMLTPAILKRTASVSKLSIVISLLTAVALYAMGIQHGYIGFTIATCCYWFLSGIQINIYSIVMSYISPPDTVGANFGMLGNTTLIGAVVGSFVIGPLVHYCGSASAFLLFGVLTIAARLTILSANYDIIYKHREHTSGFKTSWKLWILLIALNTGMMLSFMGRFNLSLIMKEQHYKLDDISYIFAWGALLVLPLPYVFGLLSQRRSNKVLLLTTLACVTASMWLLYQGSSYSAYLSVSFLICIMTYCSRGVSQKLIYDMYPLGQQAQAQSVLALSNWVAAIAGFVLVSVLSGIFPLQDVSLLGFVLGIASLVLLLALPVAGKTRA